MTPNDQLYRDLRISSHLDRLRHPATHAITAYRTMNPPIDRTPQPPAPPTPSEAAATLGRQAAGVPKRFSPEELAKRTARINEVNAGRKAKVELAKGKVTLVQVAHGVLRATK